MVSKSYSLVVINIIMIVIINLCALWIPWIGIKLEGAETKLELSIVRKHFRRFYDINGLL